MAIRLRSARVSLIVASFLLVAVGLVIALGVIPAVSADASPHATPERAVPALWAICAMQLLAAACFLSVGITSRGRTVASMILQTVLGLLVILLGFGLTDAAAAYLGMGPQIRPTAILLIASAAATFLGGLMGIAVAYLIPKRA